MKGEAEEENTMASASNKHEKIIKKAKQKNNYETAAEKISKRNAIAITKSEMSSMKSKSKMAKMKKMKRKYEISEKDRKEKMKYEKYRMAKLEAKSEGKK